MEVNPNAVPVLPAAAVDVVDPNKPTDRMLRINEYGMLYVALLIYSHIESCAVIK